MGARCRNLGARPGPGWKNIEPNHYPNNCKPRSPGALFLKGKAMINDGIKAQLKEHFKDISTSIQLNYYTSQHPKQHEMVSMVQAIAETSSQIEAVQLAQNDPNPRLEIQVNGIPSGIEFIGVAGGHEFSSLVLAILNGGGKGKWPDQLLQSRVTSLKGQIHLRTYVSLSCTNCPDVVQALNQMALLKEDFTHSTVVGDYAQEDIDRLGI